MINNDGNDGQRVINNDGNDGQRVINNNGNDGQREGHMKRVYYERPDDQSDNEASNNIDRPNDESNDEGTDPPGTLTDEERQGIKEKLIQYRRSMHHHTFRTERASHHQKFLQSCRDTNRYPMGLTFQKSIIIMRGKNASQISSAIDDILSNTSRAVAQTLINYMYYEALVMEEMMGLESANTQYCNLLKTLPQCMVDPENSFMVDLDAKVNKYSQKLDARRQRKLHNFQQSGIVRGQRPTNRNPRQRFERQKMAHGDAHSQPGVEGSSNQRRSHPRRHRRRNYNRISISYGLFPT